MRYLNPIPVGILAYLLASYGCATQPPEEEIRLAQVALDQAKRAQADKLAGLDFENAMKAFNDAEHAIKVKRYSDAKLFYTKARSRFETATKIANGKRVDLEKEIKEARKSITTNFDKLKTQIATGKISTSIKKQARQACGEIEQSIAELDKSIAQGDVVKAKLNSKDILEKVYQTSLIVESGRKG